MRIQDSHLIFMFTKGKIEGQAAEVILEMLSTRNRDKLREAKRGLWGARVTPEVEARLLEIAKTDVRHDAINFGLSTLQNKSRDVIEAMIEAAGDADFNINDRAVWGLGNGIPDGNKAMVADAFLKLFEARSWEHTRILLE